MAGHESVSQSSLRPLRSGPAEELELARRPLEVVLHLTEALAAVPAEALGRRALTVLGECLSLPAALLFTVREEGGLALLEAAGVDPARLGEPVVAGLAQIAAQGQGLEVQALGFHPRLNGALKSALQAAGYQALLEIPLTHRERRTGGLLFLLRAPRVLSMRQSETLLAIGRVLGAALADQVRRQEQEHELAAQREALVAAEETLRYTEERYQQLGISDALTGLYNSRHFHGMLEAEVERARRFGDALGLMLLDIDDLKRFNDTYGREAGDQVLARLGRILRWSVRKIDSGFRYGGEEFAVILPRCDQDALARLAERVRTAFESQEIEVPGGTARLSVSIGAALYRRASALESFIRCADRALYEAKTGGKNRVVLSC